MGYLDAGHDGGVDGRHALDKQRVARRDHASVAPAAIVREARPVCESVGYEGVKVFQSSDTFISTLSSSPLLSSLELSDTNIYEP